MRITIGIKVLVIVLLLGGVQAAYHVYFVVNQISSKLYSESQEDLIALSTRYQQTLEYLLRQGEQGQIQKEVSAIGADKQIKVAALLTSQDAVQASIHFADVGNNVADLVDKKEYASLRKAFLDAKNSLRSYTWVANDKASFFVAQPVVYAADDKKSLRDTEIGVLLIQYSTNWIQGEVISALRTEVIPLLMVLLMFLLMIGILVYLMITRRIQNISQSAASLVTSNYTSRLSVSGNDEISDLGNTFNLMAEQIQDHYRDLDYQRKNLDITLNSIGDGVIATDEKGYITRMNPVAEALTGWTLDEAQGESLKTVFNIIDTRTCQRLETPVAKVIENGQIVHMSNHTTLLEKSGTQYHIADSAAPIRDELGEIRGVILIFSDVTEAYKQREKLLQSQKSLNEAQHFAKMGNWRLDVKNDVLEWSDEVYNIFEINKSQFSGHYLEFLDLVHPEDKEYVNRQYQRSLKEQTAYDIVHRLLLKDGRIKYVRERGQNIYQQGEAIQTIGTVQDITEQHLQEQQLRQAQKMDALGKLTGGIAHDYNNMLGVILGYAELLKLNPETPASLIPYVEEIQRAGERSKSLTSKLLNFSSKGATAPKKTDINALITNEKDMLLKTLTARIKIKYDLSKDLWPVYLDQASLEDAILNICINAMHAMPNGGVLTLSTSNIHLGKNEVYHNSLPPGDYVVVAISDSGTGMTKEVQEKIFDPFFTTKGESGTGLGMSQVYGFVQQSHGAVHLYSEPGHGTRIVIYFPRYQDSKVIPENTQESNDRSIEGHEVILIVDDELALLQMTKRIIEAHGYRVLSANSGEEALAILALEPVDLLVSDVIMPGMDGYELVEKVLEVYPKVKIQMASGFSDDLHIKTGKVFDQLNAQRLQKPYSSETLLKRIRQLLDE